MKRGTQNLLELRPRRARGFLWTQAADGSITVSRPNLGLWNRLAQLLYRAPKKTCVRLDALGSFVWTQLDGAKTVQEVAEAVSSRFGGDAEPLYPRLAQYLRDLRANRFICY